MGLAEDTLAKLVERQNAERNQVRDITKRYEKAAEAAAKARKAMETAEAECAAALVAWAGVEGWTPERVAECVGIAPKEVSEMVRSAPTDAVKLTARPTGSVAPKAPIAAPQAPSGSAA